MLLSTRGPLVGCSGSRPSVVRSSPLPPLLLAPNTPLALGTVDKPNTALPPGPGGAGLVASLRAKMPLWALDSVKATPPSSERSEERRAGQALWLAPKPPHALGNVEKP